VEVLPRPPTKNNTMGSPQLRCNRRAFSARTTSETNSNPMSSSPKSCGSNLTGFLEFSTYTPSLLSKTRPWAYIATSHGPGTGAPLQMQARNLTSQPSNKLLQGYARTHPGDLRALCTRVAVKGSQNCQRDESPSAERMSPPAHVALCILEEVEHLLPLSPLGPKES